MPPIGLKTGKDEDTARSMPTNLSSCDIHFADLTGTNRSKADLHSFNRTRTNFKATKLDGVMVTR